jgi:glycosyltransferase involved in cell wall biosynthesis
MQKKTILHFIYSLGRGGAEVMMVRVIKELSEYNNIVVEIYGKNSFGDELKCDKYISMNLKSLLSLPVAIFRLRALLKKYKVDIIHTHLFWPTAVARIATPKKVTLITTIHTSVATSLDYRRRHIRVIDKLTYRLRKSIIIAVSKNALAEYFTFLKLQPAQSYLLYTFADNNLYNFEQVPAKKDDQKFLLISVGALRQGKNFEYLVKAFCEVKNPGIELHIYGTGVLEPSLKKLINEYNVPVFLKGETKNLHEILGQYHLYVSASKFEGFSLSVLEAMSMKLPLLLSNINSFREQCEDTAIYFDLNKQNDFVEKLDFVVNNREKLNKLSNQAHIRFLENFTLDHHVKELKKIYKEASSKITI